MAFENEQTEEQQFSQNINDTEKSSAKPIDNNSDNNNPPPPPDVNGNGDVVKMQTKSIQVGSSAVYTPSSHEELEDLVSEEIITKTHKTLFILKYEAWYGELPKATIVSKDHPSKLKAGPVQEKGKQEDKMIDLNTLFPELQNQPLPEEDSQPKIDLNALHQEENTAPLQETTEKKPKGSGNVPKDLKNKIEQASGVPLDDVTVHYNSPKPFKYEANAFAKGNEVFLAPGQEEHLSEELWHVVQQKQGLVKSTGVENGVPINDAPNLEHLAKGGQSKDGEKEQKEEQKEVLQKNDDKLTFVVPVNGSITGKDFMLLIERQIYGQVINSPWEINGVAIDPNQIMGEEGKTISYNVTVLAAKYKQYRSGSKVGSGVELDDDGAVKGAEDRNKELDALPKGTKDALTEEINRRFQEASGKEKKEPKDEALWNVYRDEVLAQREKVLNLSQKAKQLIIEGEKKGGIIISPKDYPKAIALIEKIEGLNDALVTEYASRVTGKASSIEDMQKSLDAFIQEQEGRGDNKTDRTDIENELFATEAIFDDLQTFESLAIANSLGGGTLGGTSASMTFYDKADEAAKERGFEGVGDYEAKMKEYLASFQKESVATGLGLLQKYEHFLYQEEQRYLNSTDAKTLGDGVDQSGAKQNYEAADQSASNATWVIAEMGGKFISEEQMSEKLERRQNHLDDSAEQEGAANTAMQGFGKDHPLLTDPAFDLKKLSKQSPEETQKFLLDYIKKQKESIAETKAKMQEDEDFIFTLDNLMAHMYQQEGIATGSIQDKMLQDHIGDIKLMDTLISVGIALLAIGLGLLSGGTGTVGVLAAVGSVGVSIYDVTREFGKYTEEQNAHDVGLLSKDPSFAWVMLAMVGAGLDFALIAKLLKPLKAPVEGFNQLAKTDPALALAELDGKLAKIDGIDDALKANILKRAENKSEFLKNIRSMNVAAMQIIPGSKQLADLAVYAVKSGITRVDDFFKILKQNGLKKSLGDLTGDEVKALREALETATSKAEVDNLIAAKGAVLTDDQTKILEQIKREIPAPYFKILESKKLTKEGLENYAEALRLAGDDTIARSEIIEYLRLITEKGSLSIKQMESALKSLNGFMQKYKGRISGDFGSRFIKAVQKGGMLEAQAEIKLAEDLLEGRTVLGKDVKVEGLKDGVIEGVQTPEYRMITASGDELLSEMKALSGLSENSLKRNLKKAISQIKEQLKVTKEQGGYIRIDASNAKTPTTMSKDDIFNAVNGQLLESSQRGIDYIRYIEILYKGDKGGVEKILFEVKDKTLTII
jgi:hypothetical protein